MRGAPPLSITHVQQRCRNLSGYSSRLGFGSVNKIHSYCVPFLDAIPESFRNWHKLLSISFTFGINNVIRGYLWTDLGKKKKKLSSIRTCNYWVGREYTMDRAEVTVSSSTALDTLVGNLKFSNDQTCRTSERHKNTLLQCAIPSKKKTPQGVKVEPRALLW